ncbi:hypothetical protein FANTH_3558 [Fusarium anthophilum]|uniref:Aminoglycoside phosphotransferase domain-containing protein n=1 Tax=Fusarium anthophilum TaxID=48485 RepID=A0A8H4ZS79_9HYPO|nr:hypothetical protein FANTH_3558 [Fusarium anthophilum]
MSTTAKRPKVFAYANFDLDALISLAARLRRRSCTVDTSARPRAGSTHWALFIAFEDGVEWAFRSPRRGLSAIIAEESASKLLISKASTLKYLRGLGSIPVPEVFSSSGDGRNEIGVPYILMSKASGRPLSDYDWIELSRIQGYTSRRPLLLMTHRDREKIGSLFQGSNGNYSVGECLSPSFLWQHRDELEGIDRGPFDQESQYLRSLISAFKAHAEELSLTPHSFFAPIPDPFEYPNWASYRKAVERWQNFCSIGDKVEGNKNRLDFCIAGQFLNELIPHLASEEARFVLCHPDLHLGNIFIDEDFDITCIIDWSSASTSPLAELLSTPGLNGSLSPPNPSLVTAFRSALSNRGQVLGHQQWERTDRMCRCLTLYTKRTQTIFLGSSMRGACKKAGQAQFAKLCQGESEEEEDEPTQKDDNNGQTNISVEVVVARKLTLMHEMNSNFVADKRLWLWIESVLETLDI